MGASKSKWKNRPPAAMEGPWPNEIGIRSHDAPKSIGYVVAKRDARTGRYVMRDANDVRRNLGPRVCLTPHEAACMVAIGEAMWLP